MSDTRNWQYKTIYVKGDMWGHDKPESLQRSLDEAGHEGWELVCALHPYGQSGATLFFKRPL